jgi:hypothetical protein
MPTLETNNSQAWPFQAQPSSAHKNHSTIIYLKLTSLQIPEILKFHNTNLSQPNLKTSISEA